MSGATSAFSYTFLDRGRSLARVIPPVESESDSDSKSKVASLMPNKTPYPK